jgi:hypothetical protein
MGAVSWEMEALLRVDPFPACPLNPSWTRLFIEKSARCNLLPGL